MSGSPQTQKNEANGHKNGQSMFASLTAGLMARKGEAMPAPAHLDGVSIHSHGVAREPLTVQERNLAQGGQGGTGRPTPHEARDEPLPPSEEDLRRRATRRAALVSGDCCALPLPAAVTEPMPEGVKSTVTTRLDPERVRKLKILAARMGTSNQKVMLAALDHYLEYACDVLAAECPCLARSMAKDR